MPELPEVEVTRRGLADLEGESVVSAQVRCAKLRSAVPDLQFLLGGMRLVSLTRRAKYLVWQFESQDETEDETEGEAADGPRKGWMVSHLGMTGVWRLWPTPAPDPAKHDHIDIVFPKLTARMTDPRRFGEVLWFDEDPRSQPPLSKLGPEPFDDALTEEVFYGLLHARKTHVKAVLLAGIPVVGCGNIYCSESLFEAGIAPTRRADRISRARSDRLLACIRAVLSRAIEAGGSTLRDFHGADGKDGYFTLTSHVYDREGEPCPVCGTPIRRIVQEGRSTYYCPQCQK